MRCTAAQAAGRRVPFAFLEDARARFTATYGNAREVRVCCRAQHGAGLQTATVGNLA